MADRTIARPELRNNADEALRASASPRRNVGRESVLKFLASPIDSDFARDLDEAEAPLDNPWNDD